MSITKSFTDVWRYRGLIGNFASRDLKGKYKGSLLGSAWSLLNPMATLLTYSVVFGFIIKFPVRPAGNGTMTSFPIYLFTALVVWNFFYSISLGGMGALTSAGQLLRKVYFPPFAPVFGSSLAVLNQTAIEFGILLVVLVIAANIGWTVLWLPVLLIFLAAFSLGIGLFLAMLNARYRDVNYIFTVLFNFLFYSAPIIYPVELVRAHYASKPWMRIYEYNPITVFVGAFRSILWDLKSPSWWVLGYMFVASAVVLCAGWIFFQRRAPDVSEEL